MVSNQGLHNYQLRSKNKQEINYFYCGLLFFTGYISIGNITANLIDSDTILHLTWELNNDDIDNPSYMIKYKVNNKIFF